MNCVAVDKQGEEVEEEAVPHVEDTADLGKDNPDEADPPEVQCSEGCSNDVAERAGDEVTNDVLDGVTWKLLLSPGPVPAHVRLVSCYLRILHSSHCYS